MPKQRQILTLLLFLLPLSGQAVMLHTDYQLVFHPPNPCHETSLGDLTAASLGGTLRLFYQSVDGGDMVAINPGPPNISSIGCGSEATGSFDFDLDLSGGPVQLFLSFAGYLQVNPGPPQLPLFAFWPGSDVSRQPDAAPLLALGLLSTETSPGPPNLPLFAFASPGHEMGWLEIGFSRIPETGSLALLVTGLLLLLRHRCR